MTDSREELIEAMAQALCEVQKYPTGPHDVDRHVVGPVLDALLTHPAEVLDLLADGPCDECEGLCACPYRARFYGEEGHDPDAVCIGGCVDEPACVTSAPENCACGSSGRRGREGVAQLLGMERVEDWVTNLTDPHYCDGDHSVHVHRETCDESPPCVPVFAFRVTLPEPSEGER